MRKYKFRAFDKTGKKMLYDFNIGINAKSENDIFYIMQYTGLKDKNDIEICEGDIVRVKLNIWDTLPGVIKWNNNFAEYDWMYKRGSYKISEILHEAEVIGNIYENPNLLEAI